MDDRAIRHFIPARDVIPKSIQLVAGRSSQEYNKRKTECPGQREKNYRCRDKPFNKGPRKE
ncbi:MAG: hypothetical protein D8M57_10135 [Candidatus Scalindua sp. AMX11]|nr:MAG: hypothetical protein D8M57_10135 [Candidatus Scalindua sp. AMX11]